MQIDNMDLEIEIRILHTDKTTAIPNTSEGECETVRMIACDTLALQTALVSLLCCVEICTHRVSVSCAYSLTRRKQIPERICTQIE